MSSALKPNMVYSRTILDKIWKDLYKVKVPLQYLYDVDEVKRRGLPSTGDPEQDRIMLNEMTITYKTINEVFEYYRQGVPVAVCDYNDTKTIYEVIQSHLQEWLRYMQFGVHLGAVPFDDLLDLDQFASVVYQEAKFVFDPLAIQGLKRVWNGLGIDLSPGAFFNKKGGVRFLHLLKSDQERDLETTALSRHLLQRQEMADEIMKLANRYDVRPQKEQAAQLRFANDGKW